VVIHIHHYVLEISIGGRKLMEQQHFDANQSHVSTVHASCPQSPKWEALIDDERVPLPKQIVRTTVIKAQASVPDEKLLVRWKRFLYAG
jgi:hypothetical protein